MQPTLRFTAVFALIVIASSLTFPAFFNGPYPHPPGPTLDRAVSKLYLHQIDEARPELVLLGDSILTKGVDGAAIESRLGTPTLKLDVPGSSSALWYLILKSNIVPAETPPRTLVVLFRDTLLTAPTFRVTGPYFSLVDKFAPPKDALLMERAYLVQLSPAQMALEMYFPLYTYRAELRESVDAALRHTLPALADCDTACSDSAIQNGLGDVAPDIFATNIRWAEQYLYTPDRLDFTAQVDRSFLPEIIRLAQQRNIRLVFVRAPTRIFASPDSEPAELKTYMTALDAYLQGRDVYLLDLAWAEGIQTRHFSDPHHMTVEGKQIFTNILAEKLAELVK